MKTKRTINVVVLLLLLFLSAEFGYAQIKDQEAVTILNKYVAAIGGKDAVNSIKNLVSTSKLEFVGADFSLERKTIETSSDQTFTKVNSARTGEIIRTYDGTNCMEIKGDSKREITGEEKQSYLNTSAFMRFANWENFLLEYKYDGVKEVEGKDMHKLLITSKFGINESWYFDTESNLLTQIEEELSIQGEKAVATTVYSDYRAVNGVLLSFQQTIRMPGQTRKSIFSEILANQVLESSVLELWQL